MDEKIYPVLRYPKPGVLGIKLHKITLMDRIRLHFIVSGLGFLYIR